MQKAACILPSWRPYGSLFLMNSLGLILFTKWKTHVPLFLSVWWYKSYLFPPKWSQNKRSKIKSVFFSSYCMYGNCLEPSLSHRTIGEIMKYWAQEKKKKKPYWLQRKCCLNKGLKRNCRLSVKHSFSRNGAVLIRNLQALILGRAEMYWVIQPLSHTHWESCFLLHVQCFFWGSSDVLFLEKIHFCVSF